MCTCRGTALRACVQHQHHYGPLRVDQVLPHHYHYVTDISIG